MASKKNDDNLVKLRTLGSLNDNKQCFDCHQKGPTYVNMTIGAFVCTKCSGLLRGLNPPHRVKSISMATFSSKEIEFLEQNGNSYCQSIWLGLFDAKSYGIANCASGIDDHRLKEFLIDKYEKKIWYVAPEELQQQIEREKEILESSGGRKRAGSSLSKNSAEKDDSTTSSLSLSSSFVVVPPFNQSSTLGGNGLTTNSSSSSSNSPVLNGIDRHPNHHMLTGVDTSVSLNGGGSGSLRKEHHIESFLSTQSNNSLGSLNAAASAIPTTIDSQSRNNNNLPPSSLVDGFGENFVNTSRNHPPPSFPAEATNISGRMLRRSTTTRDNNGGRGDKITRESGSIVSSQRSIDSDNGFDINNFCVIDSFTNGPDNIEPAVSINNPVTTCFATTTAGAINNTSTAAEKEIIDMVLYGGGGHLAVSKKDSFKSADATATTATNNSITNSHGTRNQRLYSGLSSTSYKRDKNKLLDFPNSPPRYQKSCTTSGDLKPDEIKKINEDPALFAIKPPTQTHQTKRKISTASQQLTRPFNNNNNHINNNNNDIGNNLNSSDITTSTNQNFPSNNNNLNGGPAVAALALFEDSFDSNNHMIIDGTNGITGKNIAVDFIDLFTPLTNINNIQNYHSTLSFNNTGGANAPPTEDKYSALAELDYAYNNGLLLEDSNTFNFNNHHPHHHLSHVRNSNANQSYISSSFSYPTSLATAAYHHYPNTTSTTSDLRIQNTTAATGFLPQSASSTYQHQLQRLQSIDNLLLPSTKSSTIITPAVFHHHNAVSVLIPPTRENLKNPFLLPPQSQTTIQQNTLRANQPSLPAAHHNFNGLLLPSGTENINYNSSHQPPSSFNRHPETRGVKLNEFFNQNLRLVDKNCLPILPVMSSSSSLDSTGVGFPFSQQINNHYKYPPLNPVHPTAHMHSNLSTSSLEQPPVNPTAVSLFNKAYNDLNVILQPPNQQQQQNILHHNYHQEQSQLLQPSFSQATAASYQQLYRTNPFLS